MSLKLQEKLDLVDFISEFNSYYSYKGKTLSYNQNIKLEFIKDLEKLEFKALPEIEFNKEHFKHLEKFGILKIRELSAIIKIVKYFKYLKSLELEGHVLNFCEKIEIKESFSEILDFFTDRDEFNSEIDPEIIAVNESIKRDKESIKNHLSDMVKNSNISSILVDTQIHLINGRETLLCKGGFSSSFSGQIVGNSGAGYFYVEPQKISKIYNHMSDLETKKIELIFEYEKRFSELFRKNLLYIKFLFKEFELFDEYQARLLFAKSKDLNFIPKQNSSDIILKEFTHPCLGRYAKPVSIDFTKSALIITGVNAGGKTILLKSILSSVYLSRLNIPYKCNESSFIGGDFKEIVAILDNIQDGGGDISTFAGRMLEFSSALKKGKKLLLGIDEVELGTDSNEASLLFNVLVLEFIKSGSKIVLTTHHKELAYMLSSSKDVSICAALYDEHNEMPLYEFESGLIGKSYAFETAQRYGVPSQLVAIARKGYSENRKELDKIVEESTELKLSLTKRESELAKQSRELEEIKASTLKKSEKLQKKYEEMSRTLELSYSDAINKAKEAIKAKSSADGHRILNKAHKLKPKIQELDGSSALSFSAGEIVRYKNSNCELIRIDDKKAMIETNGMKIKVNIDELSKGNKSKKVSSSYSSSVEKKSVMPYLDMHGMRYEEAQEALDLYISSALTAGYESVLIMHGLGSGVLGKMTKEFLQNHKRVKSFKDASPKEGGMGAKRVFF